MRSKQVGALLCVLGVLGLAVPVLVAGPATADSKVTICHRTHSTTNPYRRISVSISAVNGSGGNDHTHHWGALFDPAYAYPPSQKIWGDIIPLGNGGQTGVNWTTAGQATYANRCGAMTAQQFFNTEREAGVAKAIILADLLEQGADGDPTTFTTMTYTGTAPGVTDTEPVAVITTVTDPVVNPSVSPSPTPSASASASASPSPSPEASASPDPSPSPAPDPSLSPDPTPSPAPSPTSDASPSPDPSSSPSPDASASPSQDASPSPDASSSPDPRPSPDPSPSPNVSASPAPALPDVPSGPSDADLDPGLAVPLPDQTAPTADSTPTVLPSPILLPAPDVVTAPGDGEVAGIVWFDRNDNASLDGQEWLLPAVPVTLTRIATPGLLRVQGTVTSYTKSALTGPGGSYRFTGLPPGAYRVTAALQEEGFGYTSDTDGLADWRVEVGVVQGRRAVADFAGLGKGRLTGQVLDTVERHPVAAAGVRCTWAGFDDVFGTADDVDLTDTADAEGSYDWRGVPYGAFTCVGKDPIRGTLSAAASVRVVSAAAVHATLPLGLRRAPAASRSGDGRSAALPRTGASTDTAVPVALLLIGLGIVVQHRGRRRTT